MSDPAASAARAVAEAHRTEWTAVLAAVVHSVRDLDVAEDAAADAFLAAVRKWGRDGVPDRPGAWLTTVARRRALDRMRRDQALRDRLPLLITPERAPAHEQETVPDRPVVAPDADDSTDDHVAVPEDELRLVFLCCHPALAPPARVALTLRLVCGLATADIARLFLLPEATMAARLTRAKKKIRVAGIPFRLPRAEELPDRLPAVLATIYLVFTEGHTAGSGALLVRPDLVERALRLADSLVGLLPENPDALGLLALLRLTDARRVARQGPDGRLVPLAEQDRSTWDRGAITEGLALVERALRLARPPGGPMVLQAGIAALHAEAPSYAETDWPQILAFYDLLLTVQPTPVTRANRAVAVAMVRGAAAGLAALDGGHGAGAAPENVGTDAAQASYVVAAVRADLLRRLGRSREAAAAYRVAARLTGNEAVAAFLRTRADGL